jgi:hypothetical protein
VVTAAVEEL